jgi:RNA polymerase sigma-70 factor (ECF subfamily)
VRTANPLMDLSDEDLMTNFCRGRQEAFGVLVRRYEKELYGYLRRYLGDATLAEDVFQNTFLQVVTKSDQYQEGRPVRPWLYAIATNQAVDALRRAGRHAAVSLDAASEDNNGELKGLLKLLTSKTPGPLERTEGEERGRLVRASVDKLPEFLRSVVVLAYYQGLKYREVAELLGIPVGTVKSRLHAALTKLNESWRSAPTPPRGRR